MLETIRELSRDVKLQNLIINSFVPAEYQVSITHYNTDLVYQTRPLSHPFLEVERGFSFID